MDTWAIQRFGPRGSKLVCTKCQTYAEKVHMQVPCYWCRRFLLVLFCDQRDQGISLLHLKAFNWHNYLKQLRENEIKDTLTGHVMDF